VRNLVAVGFRFCCLFDTFVPLFSDILKTIGSSSKMLTDAIGERITDKTSSAKHKLMKEYKHSVNALGSWTSDTKTNTAKKLKNVKEKFENLSLTRRKARRSLSNDLDERPQTINIGNDEMFQSLTFNSPMNNQRSYNLENIPGQIGTYEVPKNAKFSKFKSSEDLPSYDDVVNNEFLTRNTKLTQSFQGMQKQNNVNKVNASDTVLNTISSDDDSSDAESLPPNIPAPQLADEPVYGRVKRIPNTVYENAPIVPLRKPPPPPTTRKTASPQAASDFASNRVTISSTISDSCTLNESSLARGTTGIDRSESWRFVSSDNVSRLTADSVESLEPIYSNDENERMPRPSKIAPMSLLEPTKILNTDNRQSTMTRDILNEFDPLSRESFDQFVSNNMNHLTLLETLLSEETYGTIGDNQSIVSVEGIDETSSDDLNQSDQLNEAAAAAAAPTPLPPERRKHQKSELPRQQSVIIHQNLRLKDSIENLVEPFLAKVEDQPSTSEVVDLTKPKAQASSSSTPSTHWFVDGDDTSKFVKNNLDNPKNFAQAPTEKVTKTVPQLTKVNNLSANRDSSYLPSYEESKNDEIVRPKRDAAEEKTPNGPVKSRSTIFNFNLMRRSSIKEKKIDPKDFIVRPPFGEEPTHAHDKSVILFKLPSGVIEDMLKELNPRFIELRKRQFKAFADPEMKVLKEHLDLSHLSSVHYLVNHKFSDFKTECGRQIFCFEINLAVPKSSGNASTSNALLDSKGSPVRTQRVTYVYGIHSKQEK
jgi:Arf-GAP/Rho-GAP domain/ANK repeat/PH domain-containing protein 1